MTLLKIALLSALVTAAVWAQATAQIHGIVQDPSGAAIPGAMVKATQTDTGLARTVTSEADGGYVFPNLPLGPYQLEVSKGGFATAVQMGIVLQVGSNPAIPFALKVGAVTEQVVVEANTVQVDTSSVSVGNVIENQRVVDLPLNGRSPTDLITLSGAAVQTSSASGTPNAGSGQTISVAGASSQGVQYYLDGAPYSNPLDGTGMNLPFPDALQEFRLTTGTQDASNSGHSGASVNAVTKSGTNSFHGDVFWFLRNYAVNARDFFARGPDGLKRNQPGGTFGGPILKDKLFFFMGYQGTFVRQTPISNTTFVPTPDMLQGNFTTYASAACQGTNRTLAAPFVNNAINSSSLNPAAVNISKLLPAPVNDCGLVYFGSVIHQNQFQVPVRLDYQVNDKQSLFARYQITNIRQSVPYDLSHNLLDEAATGLVGQAQAYTFGHTYVISSTMVNSLRASLNRIADTNPNPVVPGVNAVGINMYTNSPNLLYMQTTGGFSLGNTSNGVRQYLTTFGINDDFSLVHGSHQFKFGGSARREITWFRNNPFGEGQFIFSATTGLGLADFLLGRVSSLRQAGLSPTNMRQNFFSLYAQDTWKITRQLTLNYGISWEPWIAPYFPHGDTSDFSVPAFYAGVRSKVFPTAPPGFTFPGDSNFPGGNSGINSQWGNFDPRIGIAWDPKGDGKTAVRASAGIARDYFGTRLMVNAETVSPFIQTVVATGVTLDNPWAGYPGGDPFPSDFNKNNPIFAPYGSQLPSATDLKSMTQYSWNLAVQRQITPKWFASATYLGTHIVHVWDATEDNPAQYIPGNCGVGEYGLTAPGLCTQTSNINNRRILNLAFPGTQLGYITQYDTGGTQGYNGLLLNTNWRLGSNVTLNANYTWSHCIASPVVGSLGGSLALLNPGQNYEHQPYQNIGPVNRDLDTGNCIQDRRQVSNVTLVAQTPRFSNRLLRMAASGWTSSTTIVARTGAPLNVTTGNVPDPATGFGNNTGGGPVQFPNLLLPNAYSTSQRASCNPSIAFCEQWLNPAAFSPPALGTFGNLGQYVLYGPSFWEWDQAISRQFPIREKQRMEVRFEAFNVTNSFRPGNPGVSTAAASSFGLITSDATPPSANTAPSRALQFALKYVF
jgi:hypothetical protein